MKNITALLGMLGVVSMFYACAADTVSSPYENGQATNSSSSAAPVANLSATTDPASSSSVDTVHTQVVISSAGSHATPNYSNGIFCWTSECEKTNSAASSAPLSSASIEISTPATTTGEPPIVTETEMTDQRDQKKYKLIRIGNVHWMAENLNYATKTGSYCSDPDKGTDMCSTYGVFYVYSAASRACPAGWRLPTEAEVSAADKTVDHSWWQIGGRFKLENDKLSYGLADEQGYIWIEAVGENTSFRVKNYGGSDNVHEFQTGSLAERAYNVRCVSTEM